MKNKFHKIMPPGDERQYMLNDEYEIFEKCGVPTGAMHLHYHNFYEVLYIMEGEFASLIENTTYHLKKGDFLLIEMNRLHHYQFMERRHENSKRILLWITREMLNKLSGKSIDLSACFLQKGAPAYHFPTHHEDTLANFLYKIILNSSEVSENLSESRLVNCAYLTLFFVHLNRLCSRPNFRFTQYETVHNPLVQSMNDYIEAHISHAITVDDLAEYACISKYHFLRTFKSLTGMTVHDFIVKKRLIKACEEICNGCPLTEVYLKCGFSDYSSFFRNFKSTYGMPPREFYRLSKTSTSYRSEND